MKKKNVGFRPFFLLLIGVAVVGCFFLIGSIIAQNRVSSQSLEISPPTQEIDVTPGTQITIKAKVRNTSEQTLPIQVRLEDFTASGEEGQVALVQEKSDYSVVEWASIKQPIFTLLPGESKEVEAVLRVPIKAAGGRYGSFVFSVGADKPSGNNAAIAQEVASLFLIRIEGQAVEHLAIESLSAPRFSEFGPVTFSLKMRNGGNIHVKTQGLVNVTDMFGNKVTDVVIKPTNIFPQAIRILTPSLNKKFLFGTYKAQAIVYYGTKNETLTSSTSFLVIPIRLIAGIILVALLLYSIRKRIHKVIRILISGK